MRLSGVLSREKTRPSVKTTTTFNAPGNYLPPYGKTVVRITGRGATGNPSSLSGQNPVNYMVTGSNPPTYPLAATNPETWSFTVYAYSTNPGGPNAYDNWGNTTTYTSSVAPYYNYTVPGYNSTLIQHVYLSYQASQSFYNYAPGNPTYAVDPSSGYYVYVSGNTGTSANILGVTFPGGAGGAGSGPAGYQYSYATPGSLAPVVPTTTTAAAYGGSAISITVPSGGYITIDNI